MIGNTSKPKIKFVDLATNLMVVKYVFDLTIYLYIHVFLCLLIRFNLAQRVWSRQVVVSSNMQKN